jgi:DNA-directed RNA polymerase specialized sigma subunit
MKENIFITVQIIFDIALLAYLVWQKYINAKLNSSYSSLIVSIKDLLNTQKDMIELANKKIESQQESLAKVLDDVRQKNSVLTELIKSVKIKTFENDTKEKIIQMFNRSLSIEEIADQLNIPKGEVDLILKLYKGVE